MTRALLIAVVCCLLLPGLAAAQDCGGDTLVPCGAIPWRLGTWPLLASPTPMPTISVTQASGNFPPTATPVPYAGLPGVDTSGISAQIATIQAASQATPIAISDLYGSYATPNSPANLGSQAGTFFGYVRGLSDVNIGPFTPLLVFLLFWFVFKLSVWMLTVFAPVILVLIGLVRKVISFILEFIPL
jgi:hypothetical protein